MTAQIIQAIGDHLQPRGVALMIEARRMYMSMHGVRKEGSATVTMQFTGAFRDDPDEQAHFFPLARG
jgi:GTP cyclohydrolase I